MTREDKIAILTEELLKLIEEPNEPSNSNIPITETASYKKTINDLTKLNVDIDIVRKIMRRVDEVYGKAENYIITKPLYEEYGRLNND